jgi:tetratricopeptide (TPR) repeat protein
MNKPVAHVTLAVLIVLGAAVQSLGYQRDRTRTDQRPQRGIALEQEIQEAVDHTALMYRTKYYPDELLQGYVNELGQSLVPREVPPGILFSFRVIDDPVPNAVALPDGRIFIHAGLLAFVNNEAQLAMILGHEIAHVVEQHTVEAIKEARSFKRALFASLAGGLAGAMSRDAGTAEAAAASVMAVQSASFSRKQENEADLAGCRYAMSRGFDPGAATDFFEKLAVKFGDQGRLSNLLFGTHALNRDRAKNIHTLLSGDLSVEYNRLRNEGKLTVTGGQFRFHASGMVRDTAVRLAEVYDRYDLAKDRLESIADIRSHDPKTLWALGRIYRLVARTEEDKSKALDFFQRAIQADERNMYPDIQRDFALLLAARTGNTAGAAEALRKYVAGYVAKNRAYPPDLIQVYDYLLLFGDGKWVAPNMPREILAAAPAPVPPETTPPAPVTVPAIVTPPPAAPVKAPAQQPPPPSPAKVRKSGPR